MENTITCTDALEGLRKLSSESIDLIVTDPPYGMKFMGKSWDKAVPSVDVWKECLRTLKPGAFAFVMCIPRQDCLGKMIANISEAGFRTDTTSLYWSFATGFPKSTNIAKSIDKKLGVKSTVVGKKSVDKGMQGGQMHSGRPTNVVDVDETVATSPEVVKMNGSYAGYQPKPAVEIVLVAMKPLDQKTFAAQAIENGKGVTWLDDCRIPYEDENDKLQATPRGKCISKKAGIGAEPDAGRNMEKAEFKRAEQKGRFPANLVSSDNTLDDGVERGSGKMDSIAKAGKFNVYGQHYQRHAQNVGSKGSYNRFFDLDAWWLKKIEELPENIRKTLPFLIVPKPSPSERNRGLVDFDPKFEQQYNIKERVKDGKAVGPHVENAKKNFHTTVKPVKLMSYLITLGSRLGDVVLDPYIGSGTTAMAAVLADRKYIGFDNNEEYCKIAVARIKAVSSGLSDADIKSGQESLFG